MANNVTDLGKVGMTPKGAYNSATTYERLDVVTYEGSSYVSLVDSNTNNNPSTSSNKWQLMAAHGEFTEQQLEDFKTEVVAESKEEMDSYTDDKKAELDTYEGTKETELNTYTGTKKTELDTYATGLKDDFDNNATSKTTAFNTNATNKTTDFNDNVTAKTTEFNTNASNKTDDFNDNVTAKTTAFDEHVEEKTDEFDEHTEEMQQEIDELSANMPWTETEQATEIQVTDAAKYSRNKLELFGNTEQDNTKMTYKCDGAETGDYYLTYNSIDYYFTMPTIVDGDILVFDTTDLKLYFADTEITTESTGTGTNLTFIASPNPDYPQPIHVVTGENIFILHSSNYCTDSMTNSWTTNGSVSWKKNDGVIMFHSNTANRNAGIYKPSAWLGQNFENLFTKYSKVTVSFEIRSDVNQQVTAFNSTRINVTTEWTRHSHTYGSTGAITFYDYSQTMQNIYIRNFQIEPGENATPYQSYYHADYPINLGSIELRKIGDYQDYLYKKNGNWYKYEAINKSVLNGTEANWSLSGGVIICQAISNYLISNNVPFVNYFKGTPNKNNGSTLLNNEACFNNNVSYSRFYIKTDKFENIEDFKTWLSTNNLIVYCIARNIATTQITDETLIAQLDEIYEHLKLVKGTNNITVTAEDLKPYIELSYMQDLPSKLDNLDSRLSLLE